MDHSGLLFYFKTSMHSPGLAILGLVTPTFLHSKMKKETKGKKESFNAETKVVTKVKTLLF